MATLVLCPRTRGPTVSLVIALRYDAESEIRDLAQATRALLEHIELGPSRVATE